MGQWQGLKSAEAWKTLLQKQDGGSETDSKVQVQLESPCLGAGHAYKEFRALA